MSSRFAKNGDKPSERTATGRPTSLREISHTGLREWDNHVVELKGYLRDHYPDMNTICPDPLKPDNVRPSYMIYTSRPLDKETDPEGLEERKCLMAVYKDTLTLTNKKLDKQESDKEPVYYVIRSMCSIAILGADEEFLAMKSNDPLVLLSIPNVTQIREHFQHVLAHEVIFRTYTSFSWAGLKLKFRLLTEDFPSTFPDRSHPAARSRVTLHPMAASKLL